MYSGYKSFVRPGTCRYIFPVCSLFLSFFNSAFYTAKLFNTDVQFISFKKMGHDFRVMCKNSLPNPRPRRFSSIKHFMVFVLKLVL